MMQRKMSRTRAVGSLALASLLSFGGCADVGAEEMERDDVLEQASRADQGKGNGSDVVTIGDSWMSNTLQIEGTGGGIYASLQKLGLRYRNYGVQGVWMLQSSLFGPAIPTQLTTALRQNSGIKTIIMTGGGNDVIQTPGMQADCKRSGNNCATLLKKIGTELVGMWEKMGAAGVQDVLYVGYSESAGDAGPSAPTPLKNGIAELCAAQTSIRCHILDTTPLVPEFGGLAIDGIHPVAAANDRIAKAIVAKLEAEGIRR
ncbi:MAG: hypothetical protein ABW252_02280 [Polyangiales bacterium]